MQLLLPLDQDKQHGEPAHNLFDGGCEGEVVTGQSQNSKGKGNTSERERAFSSHHKFVLKKKTRARTLPAAAPRPALRSKEGSQRARKT